MYIPKKITEFIDEIIAHQAWNGHYKQRAGGKVISSMKRKHRKLKA